MLFADFVSTHGGLLFSVDSNPEALAVCQSVLRDKIKLIDQERVNLQCADSVRYLTDFRVLVTCFIAWIIMMLIHDLPNGTA
jgi:hypothetical protein